MKAIVGLGNPGAEYERTRHNVGFRVVEALARRFGVPFRKRGRSLAWARARADGETLALVEPLTFMNLSGPPVGRLAAELGIGPGDVLVVCDDIDLPLGKIRARRSGSSGGHHGLESMLGAFGTEEVARLRIGIGRRPGKDAAEFVLSEFGSSEEEVLAEALGRAERAAREWALRGIDACMNRFNR